MTSTPDSFPAPTPVLLTVPLIERISSPTVTPLPDSPAEGSPHSQGSHPSLEDRITDAEEGETRFHSPDLEYPLDSPTATNSVNSACE